jgi:hypothetical protein
MIFVIIGFTFVTQEQAESLARMVIPQMSDSMTQQLNQTLNNYNFEREKSLEEWEEEMARYGVQVADWEELFRQYEEGGHEPPPQKPEPPKPWYNNPKLHLSAGLLRNIWELVKLFLNSNGELDQAIELGSLDLSQFIIGEITMQCGTVYPVYRREDLAISGIGEWHQPGNELRKHYYYNLSYKAEGGFTLMDGRRVLFSIQELANENRLIVTLGTNTVLRLGMNKETTSARYVFTPNWNNTEVALIIINRVIISGRVYYASRVGTSGEIVLGNQNMQTLENARVPVETPTIPGIDDDDGIVEIYPPHIPDDGTTIIDPENPIDWRRLLLIPIVCPHCGHQWGIRNITDGLVCYQCGTQQPGGNNQPGTQPGTGTCTGTATCPGFTNCPVTCPNRPPPGTPPPSPPPDDDNDNNRRRFILAMFPFCLPWDVIEIIRILTVDAQTPRFEIDVFGFLRPRGINVRPWVIDIAEIDAASRRGIVSIVSVIRGGFLIMFGMGMVNVTRKYIWTGGG